MRPKILQHGDRFNPVQIQGLDDERELSTSSTIDFEHFPPHVLDHLDEIYTHRNHKRCINLTYLTLLSMTCAVIFWMIYWMIYEHCQRIFSLEETSFLCKTVFISQILIFIFIGLSPIFFILMIISWVMFACSNPIDRIRNDFIGFRLEGSTWEKQLNDYFRCSSSRKRKKLLQKNFGYMILSPYGIIFDELFLLTSSKRILINGTLIDNGRTLKLELNKYFTNEILIYLPEHIINPELIEELRKTLKININANPPLRF
jgi:hypothetical protein